MECIIHRQLDTSTREPRPLMPAAWERILACANVRRQLPNYTASVFFDIVEKLPEKPPPNGGYHVECYRSFTSLPAQTVKTNSCDESDAGPSTSTSHHNLRVGDHGIKSSPSSGVLEKKCIFCKRAYKKVNGKKQPLSQCTLDSSQDFIKNMIKQQGDEHLDALVGNISFHSKEVHYHNKCRQDYVDGAKGTEKLKVPNKMEDAYSELYCDVEKLVLGSHQPMTAKSLFEKFKPICERKGMKVPEQRTILQNTLEHFKDKLKVLTGSKKKGTILYDATIDPDLVPLLLRGAKDIYDDDSLLLEKTAKVLRQMLLSVKSTCAPLATALTSDNFKQGQAEVPQQCIQFFSDILCVDPEQPTEKEARLALSLSSDLLYGVTKGHVKPAKHLCMGVGIKSITGSEKVCEILHKFGHSISCSQEKEILTEIAEEISQKKRALPDGLYPEAGLATVIAWDNYDELVDSVMAHLEATHDTMGLVCQNKKTDDAPPPLELASVSTDGPILKKRRRNYTGKGEDLIVPYMKIPKAKQFSFNSYHAITPTSCQTAKSLDNLWLFVSLLHATSTPMWRGWNSVTMVDTLPVQRIGYMENIALPPTRLDVVQETLAISEKVRQECGEDYMIVTYDLGIAKPAMRIQEEESPKFDKLFIEIGPFHLRMSYFACVGYFITGSGLDEIVCTSDVLGSGSLSGFLQGRHFSRCTRVHPLLFAALSQLHITAFLNLKYAGTVPDIVKVKLNALSEAEKKHELVQDILHDATVMGFLGEYEEYANLTRKGDHGRTGQYAMQYIDLVRYDLVMDRALRTNDFDLYTYALGQMLPVFWAINRPNYKRWALKEYLR